MPGISRTPSSSDFTRREAAIVAASRLIKDGDAVFIGQGLPVIASLLAKRNHARKSVIMHEYGVVDTDPPYALELAHSIFAEHAIYQGDMIDALGCFVYHSDIAILGAAQIDRFGNINTTTIGGYLKPKLRISGSGGGNDIGSLAPKLLVVMDKQDKNRFPEKVDYVTTPGYLEGNNERGNLNLPGSGPTAVVTDLGIYDFIKDSREMRLRSLQPGVSLSEVRLRTGWKIKVAKSVHRLMRPTNEEIKLLRSLDTEGIYLR